jgi:hypothetical protein
MGRLCTVALEELIAFCFLPSITASLCRLPFEVLDLEAGDIFRFESIAKGMARMNTPASGAVPDDCALNVPEEKTG